MKVILQRCQSAKVTFDQVENKINYGLVIFVGFTHDDNEEKIDYLINKIINLRIFEDENGLMNKSILDISGEILSISQFTLYANCEKGRRPSFTEALDPKIATKFYDLFNQKLTEKIKTKTGKFGAVMKVHLINDGPVTIILER